MEGRDSQSRYRSVPVNFRTCMDGSQLIHVMRWLTSDGAKRARERAPWIRECVVPDTMHRRAVELPTELWMEKAKLHNG